MENLEEIPKTYADAVRTLACWHAEGHDKALEVYSLPDPDGLVVRLIEVSEAFPETGRITPVAMGRSADFPFKSCVALVTPDEWTDVQRRVIPLPAGWSLDKMERVWPV